MPIKSFRAQIASGTQDIVSLHTNNGATGYRIKKFDVIETTPGTTDIELVIKIYAINQGTTINGTVDFSDQTLLAVGYYQGGNVATEQANQTIIFDNEIFNQDIYITCSESVAAQAGNYYIELEQVKLDLNENTVATLKDIRNLS